jgi:hypothetical protein
MRYLKVLIIIPLFLGAFFTPHVFAEDVFNPSINLSVVKSLDQAIQIAWYDPTLNNTPYFIVERRTPESANFQVIATLDISVKGIDGRGIYTDSDVLPNHDYIYRVKMRAWDNSRVYDWISNEAPAHTTQICNGTLFAGGEGTLVSPFGLSTIDHLKNMEKCPGSNYELLNDIDFIGVPVNNYFSLQVSFQGQLEGHNRKIKNFRTTLPPSVHRVIGLFDQLDHATVRNLVFENVIVGGWHGVGALAGTIRSSTIENIKITGTFFLITDAVREYLLGGGRCAERAR